MINFERIMDWPSVAPILEQLDGHPELWDVQPYRRATGSPHVEMVDIWLRYNDVAPYKMRGTFSGFNDPHIPVWYPAWDVLTEMHAPVRTLASRVDADMIGGILITKLPPGGKILPHADTGWHVDYYEKFFFFLRAAPGTAFACEKDGEPETLNPLAGEVWRFDNRKAHWIENPTDTDRITAIICMRTEKWDRQHDGMGRAAT